MRIDEWCQLSQNDQIVEKRSIIYANFGHSIKRSLLGSVGLTRFRTAITSLPIPDLSLVAPHKQQEARKYGLSALAIDMASEAQYPLPSGTDPIDIDFRLSGNHLIGDEVFLNVYYRPAPPPVVTVTAGGGTVGPSGPMPQPTSTRRISWLTRVEHLEQKLQNATSRMGIQKLTVKIFFSELVALLGLRPSFEALANGYDSECRLQVVRLKTPGRLRRPHVFSRGYPERWCGVSPLQPFGATVDNRTGKAGLPEAITLASDIELQNPGSADYEAIRNRLSSLVELGPIAAGSYIETKMLTNDFHIDDDQTQFREEALRRLSPVGCTTACSGLGSADCLCN